MDANRISEIENRLKTIDDAYTSFFNSLDARTTDDINWMRSTLRELLRASNNQPSLASSAPQPYQSLTPETRIKQIMPASDWQVVYLTNEDPYYGIYNLCALALVEHSDGATEVVGLDTDMEGKEIIISQDQPGFYMIVHQNSVTEELETTWSEAGRQAA